MLFTFYTYHIQFEIELLLFVSHGGMKDKGPRVNFVMRETLFEV